MKNISQIIRGRLEKEELNPDDVLITEIEEERVGPKSFFDVRILHGSLWQSLGIWKININTGQIIGIGQKPNFTENLVSYDAKKHFFRKLKAQEDVLRETHFEPVSRILNRFSADQVKTTYDLLKPNNYIRKAFSTIVQREIRLSKMPSLHKEALSKYEQKSSEISEKLTDPVFSEMKTIILDLSAYSALLNERRDVTADDISNASEFLRIFIGFTLDLFADPKHEFFSIRERDIIKPNLFPAFSSWPPFRKLPRRYRTTEILVLLMIEFALHRFAIDNYHMDIEVYKKSIGE